MKFRYLLVAALLSVVATCARPAFAQRVLGLDVSTYQGNITQTQWNNIRVEDNRQFAFIRSSRGGTTGEDHRQGGYPGGNNTFFNLSERYDDPYFVQNINRASTAGLFAAPYHFSRLDVVASTPNSNGIPNNGTDEANHFMEMAGAWMRPGYLPPVFDLESGQGLRTSDEIAQFSIDFSNRVFAVTGIRPAIYINGNYSNVLQGASYALRQQLAAPTSLQPSVVSPSYSTLWNARYAVPVDVQNDSPRDTAATFYGPFDDFGNYQPWNFWQYANSGNLQGISPVDLNVSQGDIENLKDSLVPAVWMNNGSGDWSTPANWNSGQAAVAPASSPGQLTPFAIGPLPTPRLPGAAGPSVTDGQNDTIILERPDADVTVTISSGTHNIRKLYMREALNIAGGSLTVNYDPNYVTPTDGSGYPLFPNALRSGPISAQFSGPVTLGGTGALNVNTLQVDAGQTFTLAGGTLTFNTVNLTPYYYPPAKISVTGDVSLAPLTPNTSTITDYGYWSGQVDLSGGDRKLTVADGPADVDLSIDVPIANGELTKSGPGTMRLTAPNNYSGGTTVDAGKLLVNNPYYYSGSGTGSGDVVVKTFGTLGGTGSIDGNVIVDGGTLAPGASIGTLVTAGLSFDNNSAYDYEYDSTNLAADLLNANGGLNINGNVAINLANLSTGQVPRDTRFTLISYSGGWNGGFFAGLANNSLFNYGSNEFRIQYDDTPVGSANGGTFEHAVTLTTTIGPTISSISGFTDIYAPANWTTDATDSHGAFIDDSGAPGSVTIVGSSDESGSAGQIGYFIHVPIGGEFSFDFSYTAADRPYYDYAYTINNYDYYLTTYPGDSGHVSYYVNAGDTIGWRVTSYDSHLGPGILTITNFLAPVLIPVPTVPEPASSALVAAAIGLCAFARATRRLA